MAEDNKKEDNLTGLDQFSLDKIAGVKMGGIKPRAIDTTGIDDQISALEKPASGNVYDKMAARYRSQGEAAVLRTQKNLANLFGPTITLIQEREAAAQNRFTLLKEKLPEFDDSTIFGHQSGNPMPIVDEIKRISQATKEDMRMLSRLNINDERYDEIKKRIEKNQDAIVAFDAINEKLLEIRNSQDGREDESQWSRGMDATTRRMWEDIYASNGQNIKIQDGKLVWTDAKGTTSYEFKGGSYQDDKYKALGKTDTKLGKLAFYTRDNDGNQYTFKKGQKVYGDGTDIKFLQEALIEGGFTDADGNELDPDGEWGPKSQAAYDKYLKNKDKLEKAWLDENLTDEEKKKYQTTTGIGETKVIDLNEIGDGPTTIDNLGIKKDIEVQNVIQKLISDGVTVNTPGYESQVNALIRTINSVGPKGIKSLIFDGFGAQQGDVLKSTNTDSFIEQIIQNNPEEFGIKDVENLTQEEIANAYDIMRSRDVTYSYSNELGESKTLQSQYLQWYRKQIDAKVQGNVTTTSSSGSGSSGSGSGSGSGKTSSGNFNKDFSDLATKITDLAQTTTATSSTEGLISGETVNIKLPSFSREGVTYTAATLMIDPLRYGGSNAYKVKFTDNSQAVPLSDGDVAESLAAIYGVSKEEVNDFFKKVNQEYMDKSKGPRDDLMEQEFSNTGRVKEGFLEAIGGLADNLTGPFKMAIINNTINDKDLKDILESMDGVKVDLFTGKVTGFVPLTWKKASQLNAELEKRGIQ
tara:strand:- start:8676 stop:10928 length:2253 start_codon:yes stop_codon:yes gene_type:complete